MKKLALIPVLICTFFYAIAQDVMTPELLWKLGRVNPVGLSKDGENVIYTVSIPNVETNKSAKKTYLIPVKGGDAKIIADSNDYVKNDRISPNGQYVLSAEDVLIKKVLGKDIYPDLPKTTAQVYDQLSYRHWDEWEDGAFSHVFFAPVNKPGDKKDIMAELQYDCPQKPFGGDEDFIWAPDGNIVYVTKPKFGTGYALSTNTDIYSYNIATGVTTNLTEGMYGYDLAPAFSTKGIMAWMSMKRDGYEADKQDLFIYNGKSKINLTANWDGTVESFKWSNDGLRIYFNAPVDGTVQLFVVDYPAMASKPSVVKQITKGDFDVTGIVGQSGNTMVVTRTDMNHATELYAVDLSTGKMQQLTHVNDEAYSKIKMGKIEKRYVTTTDGKKMLVWMAFPPDFDAKKKYPTLLYCQGGPQSPLTQFYSFRWNFQLMAANGYIVVAPNRRGMYGFGREWNEAISKDWGGQVMKDYLSAIDNAAKETYVDKSRLGAVGASYGGYSIFYLAGIHNNRFKSFISHDGVFDMRSMSGTTEEIWFSNWENGGYYWEKENKVAQKSFTQFNPSDLVGKWNTPILIIQGGKDYRVPIEQGLQAFQAAQLRGIKSKLLYLPDENHWVLKAQNALVWQREFYKWLKETL